MPNEAEPGSDKPGSGSAPDSAALDKLISDKVRDAVHARISRTEEKLAKVVQDELAKLQPAKPETKTEPEKDSDKLSLKALQEQIVKLTQGIETRDKAIIEERNRATAVRIQADLNSSFAKYLGADSKLLPSQVKFYLDQFTDKDGKTVRKLDDGYGGEKFVSVAEAVDELFKDELKHLVQQSKASSMPPAGYRGAQGNRMPEATQQRAPGLNPMQQEYFDHLVRSGSHDRAAEFANQIAAGQNGTAQK